jgi:hypothetical protein
MSIDRTARALRHPGSYAAAGAIHGGMGLMTILLKMTIVWPAILCWWLVYYPLVWVPVKVYQEMAAQKSPEGQQRQQDAALEARARANHAAMRARREQQL